MRYKLSTGCLNM